MSKAIVPIAIAAVTPNNRAVILVIKGGGWPTIISQATRTGHSSYIKRGPPWAPSGPCIWTIPALVADAVA